jgi:hypothetical protein
MTALAIAALLESSAKSHLLLFFFFRLPPWTQLHLDRRVERADVGAFLDPSPQTSSATLEDLPAEI